MLNLINNNSIKIVKPVPQIIFSNIQKINSKNIHLSFFNNSSFNFKLPSMLNELKVKSIFNSSSSPFFKHDMSYSIPKVFPKDVAIDNEEKIELIKSKKVKMARPFTWEEMIYIIENGFIEVMVRTSADEAVYMNWMKVLKSKYTSINGMIFYTSILICIFHYISLFYFNLFLILSLIIFIFFFLKKKNHNIH